MPTYLARYRLAVKVLPIAAAIAVVKFLFGRVGWEVIPLNPLYTGLVAGNVFLLSFLLAGVLADYKESERLPGELAAGVETMVDECLILFEDKQAPEAVQCLVHLSSIADALRSWLRQGQPVSTVLHGLTGLNTYFLKFERLTQPNFIVRLKQEQSTMRRVVLRISTIRDTSFVGAGYAIAELTTALLVIGLLLADYGGSLAEVFLTGAISFLLIYILFLVKDLDNPFEYDGETQAGSTEVSLAPLDYLRDRVADALGAVGHVTETQRR